jgi:hypothetical protein
MRFGTLSGGGVCSPDLSQKGEQVLRTTAKFAGMRA